MGMQVSLVTYDGKPAGKIDIPDEIIQACQQLTKWMYQNEVRELGKLSCLNVSTKAHTAKVPGSS